jgi:hypothetical protein
MAVIIGVIPAILALLQGGSQYMVAKYYLYTIIIVTIIWLVVKRITRNKEAV